MNCLRCNGARVHKVLSPAGKLMGIICLECRKVFPVDADGQAFEWDRGLLPIDPVRVPSGVADTMTRAAHETVTSMHADGFVPVVLLFVRAGEDPLSCVKFPPALSAVQIARLLTEAAAQLFLPGGAP